MSQLISCAVELYVLGLIKVNFARAGERDRSPLAVA